MTERFGLLQIIVVGESILSVVSGVKEDRYVYMKPLWMGFSIVFSVYWVYFDHCTPSVVQYHRRGLIFALLHEALLLGNVGLAAGLRILLTTVTSKIESAHKHHTNHWVAVLSCFSFSLVCLAQHSNRLNSAWNMKAIVENKVEFALRVIGATAVVATLVSMPWWRDHLKEDLRWSDGKLLTAMFVVAVIRVAADIISTMRDHIILRPYWKEQGEEDSHGKPLSEGLELQKTLDFGFVRMTHTKSMFRHTEQVVEQMVEVEKVENET